MRTLALDPTPPRPTAGLPRPRHTATVTIDVVHAHLANPITAVGRLLASEADAYAHVDGDDETITVSVALPDTDDASAQHALEWVRWAAHNAGIRGKCRLAGTERPSR